jgi:hypothetical protein
LSPVLDSFFTLHPLGFSSPDVTSSKKPSLNPHISPANIILLLHLLPCAMTAVPWPLLLRKELLGGRITQFLAETWHEWQVPHSLLLWVMNKMPF